MIRWFSLVFITLSVLLMGCSDPTPAKPADTTSTSPTPAVTENLGQMLPISAVAILPNGNKINLEVAQTPKQQQMGLMYRPALPDNRGMLFKFSSAQRVSFWMKNVPVSLDMVFMRQGKVEAIIPKVPPCNTNPCPTYGPNTPIDQVIELRSGHAAELGLKVGDSVTIDFFKSDSLRR
ncbi:MAG: DUF192 domain-containing protein [Nostocaceae cyanobacterium]|nr:DUF192 domain-containing protein [Nostocaceae cyanobacterium]